MLTPGLTWAWGCQRCAACVRVPPVTSEHCCCPLCCADNAPCRHREVLSPSKFIPSFCSFFLSIQSGEIPPKRGQHSSDAHMLTCYHSQMLRCEASVVCFSFLSPSCLSGDCGPPWLRGQVRHAVCVEVQAIKRICKPEVQWPSLLHSNLCFGGHSWKHINRSGWCFI